MGDVTALGMDVITEKSGHSMVPMAVSVCITPAAPAPLPLPYPVTASSSEGIVDPAMRTKVNGSPLATVGSCLKACHGNEPGTLKEVVSLNTGGPVFIIMGAPTVLCELGMMGITGSLGISNKAITVGGPGNASDAGGTGGPGGGGGGGGGAPGDPNQNNQSPSNNGGSGGGGSNSGSSASPATASNAKESQKGKPEPSAETRKLASEKNKDPDDGKNADREKAREKCFDHYMDNHHKENDWDETKDPPKKFIRPPTDKEKEQAKKDYDFKKPLSYYPPPKDPKNPKMGEGPFIDGTTPSNVKPPNWPWTTGPASPPKDGE